MLNWYKGLSSNKKCLFLLGMLDIFVFICLVPFAFFTTDSGYWLGTLMFGWLLGSVAQIVAFSSMILTSKAFTNPNTPGALLGAGGFFIRYFLYAVVLVIAGICTFRSEWFGGFNAFNFFTCFSSLVVLSFFVAIFKFLEIRKESEPVKEEVK